MTNTHNDDDGIQEGGHLVISHYTYVITITVTTHCADKCRHSRDDGAITSFWLLCVYLLYIDLRATRAAGRPGRLSPREEASLFESRKTKKNKKKSQVAFFAFRSPNKMCFSEIFEEWWRFTTRSPVGYSVGPSLSVCFCFVFCLYAQNIILETDRVL